ncbi:MAG: vWA domain-containing protein, partial [Myxococcota bacterium]
SSSSSASSSTGGGMCPVRPIPQDENPGNVMIIQDKSGSMADSSKWNSAKLAINNMLSQYASQLRFGLALYPRVGGNDCSAGQVEVPLATTAGDNTADILDLLNQVNPWGNTPTMETLNVLAANAQTLGLRANDRQNIILLITDGQPNCSDNENTGTGTISALENLHQQLGIAVYVVGFGNGVDPDILNDMATAGGVPRPGVQRYYRADNEQQLQEALDAIGTSLVGCRYLIPGDMPTDLTEVVVRVRGAEVPYDSSHTNGWDYDPNTHAMTWYGPACDDPDYGIQGATEFQIDVTKPCD